MNEIRATKFGLYARKSSEDDERQILSIEGQVTEWQQMAKRESIELVEIVTESRSAKTSKTRPLFNKMLDDIKAGKFDGVLAWLPDRLSRNAGDAGSLVDLMDAGLLKEIRTSNQIFRGDVPNDKFMFTLMCSQAKLENDNRGINVQRGLRTKRSLGIPSGVAPYGYVNAGKTKGANWWEPDEGTPNRFLLMQEALKLVLDGIEPMEALRTLNNQWGFLTLKHRKLGGGELSKTSWYSFLRNPITCGYFLHRVRDKHDKSKILAEEWHKVNHPKYKPMITEAEYWKLQALLGKRGRTRPKLQDEDQAAFLKMITCGECGDELSRDRKRHTRCDCGKKYSSLHQEVCPNCGKHESLVDKSRKHSYDFYFCPTAKASKKEKCTQRKIDTKDIEMQTAEVLDSVTIPQEFIDTALEYLESTNDEELISQEATLESLQHSYEAKQKELNRLNRAFVKGGYDYEGGEQEYQLETRRLISEKDTLKQKIDDFDKMADDWRKKTQEGYIYCKEAMTAFTSPNADYRTKRDILYSLCEKATVKGDRLILQLELPFMFIKKKLDEIKEKYDLTEPEKIAELLNGKADKAIADAIKSTWRCE